MQVKEVREVMKEMDVDFLTSLTSQDSLTRTP